MDFWVSFGSIGLFLILALLFAVGTLSIPQILIRLNLIPRKPTPVKLSTYECGMETIGKTWVQFNFRYYFYALLFVIFDVEVIFLYPWAVAYKKLALFGLVEMLVFIGILVVGWLYAWKKGALEWK
ncbi:MAG: NADH-quinone oxidoreductase subunit A [Chloroflexota bacterium]